MQQQLIVGTRSAKEVTVCPTLAGSGLHRFIESFPSWTALRSDATSDKLNARKSRECRCQVLAKRAMLSDSWRTLTCLNENNGRDRGTRVGTRVGTSRSDCCDPDALPVEEQILIGLASKAPRIAKRGISIASNAKLRETIGVHERALDVH